MIKIVDFCFYNNRIKQYLDLIKLKIKNNDYRLKKNS